ncbi:hypothetical protein BGZ82_003883, partial [Podila clonocystis]
MLLTRLFSPLARCNYGQYVISRPDLYNLLWRQIPRENIHLGKKILAYQQSSKGVRIECSDNTAYHGDILVGADGAYSAVRQQLYRDLKADKKLPLSDDVGLPFSCICLVGQTIALDPDEFAALKANNCDFNSVLGSENRCTYLNRDTYKDNDTFRTSEWRQEEADALCREVRAFQVPGLRNGKPMTLGDYVDKTPREYTSKVTLEEIVFDTWYGGRTVLLGDGAMGATLAMHDAVTLTNWISTLDLATVDNLERVFKKYRSERLPVAKEAFKSGQMFTRNFGKNLLSVVVRETMKRLPPWIWRRIVYKMAAPRYQASFLQLVEDQAKVKAQYQQSLHKTRAILEEQARSNEGG